jgi:cytochrome c-type biogenesis protein CcmH/NrfG
MIARQQCPGKLTAASEVSFEDRFTGSLCYRWALRDRTVGIFLRGNVSQPRRRPPAKQSQKRRSAYTNRSQRIYAILGVVIVFLLIATIVGPPLIDYLTSADSEPDIVVDSDTPDPTEAEYRARIEADPNDAQALSALGNYLGNTGRVDEAIQYYERALAIVPNDWVTRLGFARVLGNGGKRPDAELQFNKVLAACPNSEQTHFSLAQLYATWVPPRVDEAVVQYQIVVAIAPSSFVAERAQDELAQLGVASPVAATPSAIEPVASPAAAEGCP